MPVALPKNETTVNLKSAPFALIMHLCKGLTHIQSQIKPWLLFGVRFTLSFISYTGSDDDENDDDDDDDGDGDGDDEDDDDEVYL